MNNQPILTDEHLRLANEGLRALYDAESLMPKCEACGIDTTEVRKAASELRSNLEAVKREFFPGVP